MLSTTLLVAALNAGAALAAPSQPIASSDIEARSLDPGQTYWPFQNFTSSSFKPPVLKINKSGEPLDPGYLFFCPGVVISSTPTVPRWTSPMIMDDSGELIWTMPNGTFANNLNKGKLDGQDILYYWSGIELQAPTVVGHYYGGITILNQSYHEIYQINPDLPNIVRLKDSNPPGWLDGHETFLMEETGEMLATVYNITPIDLTSVGGPKNGWIWNCLFYVFDIKTSAVKYHWNAAEHVLLNASHNLPLVMGAGSSAENPWDFFHINSVEPIGKDWFLVNSRHYWQAYLVNKTTHGIEWTIDGVKAGDFEAPTEQEHFEWQHDMRIRYNHSDPTFNPTKDGFQLHMLNNYNAFQDNGTAPSNGLVMHVTPPNGTHKGTRKFLQADAASYAPVFSDGQGSAIHLPNGNRLISYGLSPIAHEFGPTGDLRLQLAFGEVNQAQSMRMYKHSWVGKPTTQPSFAVKAGKGFVSWNGATEVTSYAVYSTTGTKTSKLSKASTFNRTGFETSFTIPSGAKYALIEAYAGKTPLRNSTVVAC